MYLLFCVPLVGVIHEGGHYLAALYFGSRLKFRFAWGRFGVPRFIWDMPIFFSTEDWKRKVIAAAGFGFEFLAAIVFLAAYPPFGRWYAGVALAHLVAYPWYAGEASDFKWFRRGMFPTSMSETSDDASNFRWFRR